MTRKRPRGRVEAGLDRELAGFPEISAGARAHLRSSAHAVDRAETLERPDLSAKASLAYLEARKAYGLAGVTHDTTDPFSAFVAGLSAPSVGNTPDT